MHANSAIFSLQTTFNTDVAIGTTMNTPLVDGGAIIVDIVIGLAPL